MAVVGILGQTGGGVQVQEGSGARSCAGGVNTEVTISGLDFTPDLIILYGENSYYKFSASCYTGTDLTAWNNVSWANGQPCFRLATTIGTNAFTFTLYPGGTAATINYWWRAFKLA